MKHPILLEGLEKFKNPLLLSLTKTIKVDNQEALLETIQVPKNLHFLSDKLPRQTYDKPLANSVNLNSIRILENSDKFDKSDNLLSPNKTHVFNHNIGDSIEYIKHISHEKNRDYILAPHHLIEASKDKIYKESTKGGYEDKIAKEKEFEENLKAKERKDRKDRREKRKQKEAQEKKELEEILALKQEQKRSQVEKEERQKAEILKQGLMPVAQNDKDGIFISGRKYIQENLIINNNLNIVDINNKFKSNNQVSDLSAFRKVFLSVPKKRDSNLSKNSKNLKANANNNLGNNKYLSPIKDIDARKKQIENSPFVNEALKNNDKISQNSDYIKRVDYYDVGNVYKPKLVESNQTGSKKISINRKLSPIKRGLGKDN